MSFRRDDESVLSWIAFGARHYRVAVLSAGDSRLRPTGAAHRFLTAPAIFRAHLLGSGLAIRR